MMMKLHTVTLGVKHKFPLFLLILRSFCQKRFLKIKKEKNQLLYALTSVLIQFLDPVVNKV